MSHRLVSPWELALIQQHIEELCNALAHPAEPSQAAFSPAIDLIDRRDGFLARIDVPGVRAADLEIVIVDRELHLRGVKLANERPARRHTCHRVERAFGPFAIRLRLPASVDAAACRAVLAHGVLEISLPRLRPDLQTPYRIEVTEEES